MPSGLDRPDDDSYGSACANHLRLADGLPQRNVVGPPIEREGEPDYAFDRDVSPAFVVAMPQSYVGSERGAIVRRSAQATRRRRRPDDREPLECRLPRHHPIDGRDVSGVERRDQRVDEPGRSRSSAAGRGSPACRRHRRSARRNRQRRAGRARDAPTTQHDPRYPRQMQYPGG